MCSTPSTRYRIPLRNRPSRTASSATRYKSAGLPASSAIATDGGPRIATYSAIVTYVRIDRRAAIMQKRPEALRLPARCLRDVRAVGPRGGYEALAVRRADTRVVAAVAFAAFARAMERFFIVKQRS